MFIIFIITSRPRPAPGIWTLLCAAQQVCDGRQQQQRDLPGRGLASVLLFVLQFVLLFSILSEMFHVLSEYSSPILPECCHLASIFPNFDTFPKLNYMVATSLPALHTV